MVSQVADLVVVETATEAEAFLLENELIKRYQPYYNILLKDDKTYPYIKITLNEEYPSIYTTRKILNDGAKYFGPYANAGSSKEMIEFIKQKFRIRQCKNFKSNKRVCLNYHIGRCLGPCVNNVSKEEYRNQIDEIIELFSAQTFDEEIDWIGQKIVDAIKIDKLRPDDITVVCIDDRHNKSYFNRISEYLGQHNIYTHNLSNNYYETGFIEDQCVTLSTVYKAKGNESAMVFVVGCDVVEPEKDNRTMRNKLFTAFTRAKAWLKISGLRINDSSLVREIQKVKDKNFVLDFVYKDAPIIQRDLDFVNEKKAVKRKLLNDLLDQAKAMGLSDEEIRDMMKNYDTESRSGQK